MADAFQIDITPVKGFFKVMRQAPDKARGATAGVLNNFAYGTRTEAKAVLSRALTIRSPGFVFSTKALRTIPARKRAPISKQIASTASVASDRFTGWEEQQTGKKTKRTRVGTLAARYGSKQRRMAPSARMRSGRRFMRSDKFPGRTKNQRVLTMIHALNNKARGPRQPFIITGSRDFPDGLYKMTGTRGKREIVMLQGLEPQRPQPKRFPWMTIARSNYLNRINIQKVWGRAIDHVFKKMRKL